MPHVHKLDSELKNLLQEVRISMPGVQFLFAFLLVAPFDKRFEQVTRTGIVLFLIALGCATVASALLISPSMQHRLWSMDNEHEDRRDMYQLFTRLVIAGGAFLSGAIAFALAFVGFFLFGAAGAVLAGVPTLILCGALWFVFPLVRGSRDRRMREDQREPRRRVPRRGLAPVPIWR